MTSPAPHFEMTGSGAPVILVTGLAADARAWAFQVPAFAERHRTITFDNRGVGRNQRLASRHAIADLADDVVAVLDAVGIDRAHVVGMSMGGMVAQEVALRHPSRLDRLVLVCTGSECHPEIDVVRRRFRAQLETTPIAAAFWRHALPVLFSRRFLADEWERLPELFGPAGDLDVESVLAQLDAISGHDATDRLSSIEAPTLVLTGDADQLVPLACSELLARRIPGAELRIVVGGSHCFNIEMPDTFNRIALEFLSRGADGDNA